jgi:hypothetical protein
VKESTINLSSQLLEKEIRIESLVSEIKSLHTRLNELPAPSAADNIGEALTLSEREKVPLLSAAVSAL